MQTTYLGKGRYLRSIKIHKTQQLKIILKWVKNKQGRFTEDDVWMANEHMKCGSTLLAIKEMLIKTTMRCHRIPLKMTKI